MPKKPKVVLDSVVLVSAFLTKGLASELLALCAVKSQPYTAEEILQEIRRVLLEKEHIRSRYKYSGANVEAFVSRLQEIFTIVGPLPELQVVERDPKDDMIIACAVEAKADYIISRDIHLLDLRTYEGIQIVRPEDFIHYLRDEKQAKKYVKVSLWLRVENNSKFVRGKGRSREEIERFVLSRYSMRKLRKDGWEYKLVIPYENDEDLDDIIYDMIQEMADIADSRHGFIEYDVVDMDSDRSW